MQAEYERIALAATIDPQIVDNATVTSDYIAVKNGFCVIFTLLLGAIDITVDAVIKEATDNSGTSAQNITGKAITQIAATGDNTQKIIEVRADELSAGFTHVALAVTVGDGAVGAYVAAAGELAALRYKPATIFDLASVTEIIN
jgi:hypothetical protein